MSDYLSNLDPATLANVVRQLVTDVAELKGRTVNVQTLEEFTNDLGLQQSGEFRTGNGAEPGDGFTGGRFGYPGFEYAGKTWFLVGVKNDVMMVGLDLDTGSIYGAGGELLIDDNGLTVAGMRSGIDINAVYGSYNRHFLMETILNKNSIPSGALTFADGDGAEMISNGGFELGDLTNWTPTTPEKWSIESETPFEGDCCAKCVTGDVSSDYLLSDEYTVNPGVPYHFTGAVKSPQFWAKANMYVEWNGLSGGGPWTRSEIIKFDPFASGAQLDWNRFSIYKVAPPDADGMKIRLYPATGGYARSVDVYFDAISVKPCTILRRLMLAPEAEFFDGVDYRRLLAGKKQLHAPRPPIVTLVATSTGNVTWGEHSYKVTFVDASGETIPSAVSSFVTNDTTHRQTTVIIPTGPAGTTSRKIYRTNIMPGSSYFLLSTVANNSTVSYTDNIADANLGAAAPQVDLSESNFLFPTSSKVTGGQFLKYPDIAYGWLAIAGYAMGGVAVDSGLGMQFDTYKAGFLLKSGSYKVIFHLGKAPNGGIVDVYLDGALVQASVDLYAASAAVYVLTSGTQTISEDGWHELELVVVGKNASSTGYDVRISMVEVAPVSTLTTYSSQPDETDGIDSYIRQSLASTNFGTETTMLIGWGSSTSTILRGLLKFDLTKGTNPPTAGAVVVGTPRLILNCTSYTTAKTLAAYACLRDWVESQLTWNIFSTGNNWQTAGAGGALDYDPTLLGSVDVSASGYIIMPLPVSLIQGWIDGVNYGLILRHTLETTNFNQYAAASHATAALRPKLLFEWR